jgi:hypothetical protein
MREVGLHKCEVNFQQINVSDSAIDWGEGGLWREREVLI